MKRMTAIRSDAWAAGRLGRAWGLLLALALLPCCACRPASPPAPGATAAGEAQPGAGSEKETWYVVYIQGARAGYQRTTTEPVVRDGRQLVEARILQHLVVVRDGKPIEMEDRLTSVETPDGGLVEFEVESSRGPEPTRASGRVMGDSLQIERTSKGRKETVPIPWSAGGGFYAVEQSLARNPMKPGEKRTIRALVPEIYVVGTQQLVAREYESVELPTGAGDLLRIDTTLVFPQELGAPSLEGSLWTDRSGEVVKSSEAAMNVETYRATRDEALKEIEPGGFDFVRDLKVPVARPLPSPHATRRVRYRVTVKDGDPLRVFVSGYSQKVEPVDAHTAEVTVYALRPGGEGGNPDAAADPPSDDDLEPNSTIQSDYPAIAAKAHEVAADQRDPWAVAVALERAAADAVITTDFSQAFATAAEVIESGRGDCTEHAVLLAALCRARRIPARSAIGLVYLDRAFCYHMWTEVHVDGRWIPLDATFPQGGTGAAYLKMAHSNFKKASALSAFLPVMQVIEKLKIEVLEVE